MDICCGRENVAVHVELIVSEDCIVNIERLKESFEYVSSNVTGPTALKVNPREVTYSGCSCRLPSCQPSCPCISRFGPNYTPDKKLLRLNSDNSVAGKPIFECNASCLCGDGCINRVVQNGVHHKLQVFPTVQKGWGLRTLEKIEEGTFVCEYAGEVLTCEEATSRIVAMQNCDMNYLFTVQETFGSGATSTTYIDAQRKGNIARFINHSCEPNLQPIAVRVHNEIPRIALFAKSEIQIGEELTYCYNSGEVCRENFQANSLSRKLCYCKSKVCQKYLPYTVLMSHTQSQQT